MDFRQRFFSGQNFLPRPVIDIEKRTNTLIVVTPWGSPDIARTAIDVIKEQMAASGDETAVTRVSRYIEGLSEEANHLRSAALFANDHLFLRANGKEYTGAAEIALITIRNQYLSWVQLGAPHILLCNDRGYQPVCYTPDWSWQLRQSAPLVSKALGLERGCYLNCGTHRFDRNDQIFLISRSTLPPTLYASPQANLEELSRLLVEENAEAPFWMGQLRF